MKKELRLMLEYECYPVWIYDEEGKFIDNDLVQEIEKDEKLVAMLEELQTEFDSLYLNSPVEFKYIGFSSENEKHAFDSKVQQVYRGLCDLLEGKYEVRNMVNIW